MTANQLYKSSGSELPFKEWLKREQLKGNLKVKKETFVNANGDDDVPTDLVLAEDEIIINKKDLSEKLLMKFLVGVLVGVVVTKFVSKGKK